MEIVELPSGLPCLLQTDSFIIYMMNGLMGQTSQREYFGVAGAMVCVLALFFVRQDVAR